MGKGSEDKGESRGKEKGKILDNQDCKQSAWQK